MVTKLGFSSSLSATLNYNEKKVQRGKAEVLHSGNFLQDIDKLNMYEKQARFQLLNDLRPDVTVNTLHAKIAFPATEKLSDEKFKDIADAYMKKIGFEQQPYIVYKHTDTAIPHMHVVATIIEPDGNRIPTHNLGKDKSEKARLEIEKEFNLDAAQNHKLDKEYTLKAVDVKKVEYGERGSKESMQEVLRVAYKEFKAGSFEEYNALLRMYNVHADKGSEGSRLRQRNGVQYRILNEEGKVIGTPIKASAFYFKPTLKNLEEKFKKDKETLKRDLPNLKNKIDWVLKQQPGDIQSFIDELKKDNVIVLARTNAQQKIYGLTFIDLDSKIVVNGSKIDKGYSANAILKKFDLEHRSQEQEAEKKKEQEHTPEEEKKYPSGYSRSKEDVNQAVQEKVNTPFPLDGNKYHMLETILSYTEGYDDTPTELKKDKRKKRSFNH